MQLWLLATVCVLFTPAALGQTDNQTNENPNADEVSRQLFEYREENQEIPVLTTSDGRPVDESDTSTLNKDLLTNQYFMDTITHLVNEEIPARITVPKALGAFGYFEVTNDITNYTKANLFNEVGKRTPLVARVGISLNGRDTANLALRSISMKFYTEEGNLDLLNINMPVFTMRDAIDFPVLVHAFGVNPKNNLPDLTSMIDAIILHPNSLHGVLWELSELGLPRGYRYMNVFPIHTFRLYNTRGDVHYVKFKFMSELGYKSLSLAQARQLAGSDPDFFSRDLYNSIERQNFPSWRMEMDVLSKDINDLDYDPFDVTRLWKNGTYDTVEIGRVVLNRNVDNYFAQVEQAAFNPGHLVPGIAAPLEKIYSGRVLAYREAQIHRLGINHNKIEVNCPLHLNNYNRDGVAPVLDNLKDAPNYTPNSFNGPQPIIDIGRPNSTITIFESAAVDLEPARNFYNNILVNETQRQRLVDNLVLITVRLRRNIVERLTGILSQIDEDLGSRYATSYETQLNETRLPTVVDDLPEE